MCLNGSYNTEVEADKGNMQGTEVEAAKSFAGLLQLRR